MRVLVHECFAGTTATRTLLHTLLDGFVQDDQRSYFLFLKAKLASSDNDEKDKMRVASA